jgi:hypothetical protein
MQKMKIKLIKRTVEKSLSKFAEKVLSNNVKLVKNFYNKIRGM